MADARRELGDAGEALVAAWYEAAGFRVVDRNWRCRDGELDLVVAGHGLLVFCEVKTRRSARFGAPFEAVTRAKQVRIRGLALRWLAEHPERVGRGTPSGQVRFDVASVTVVAGRPAVDVIEGAF